MSVCHSRAVTFVTIATIALWQEVGLSKSGEKLVAAGGMLRNRNYVLRVVSISRWLTTSCG